MLEINSFNIILWLIYRVGKDLSPSFHNFNYKQLRESTHIGSKYGFIKLENFLLKNLTMLLILRKTGLTEQLLVYMILCYNAHTLE